jgi:phosphoribosylpyrophosphate synthetase
VVPDHAEYISRKLAHNSNLNFQKILGRHGNARQVGATREVRLKQLQGAFYVKNSNINDKHILLVDDIVTTGGTLEAAAKVLRQAGAKQVDAVVFAQKPETMTAAAKVKANSANSLPVRPSVKAIGAKVRAVASHKPPKRGDWPSFGSLRTYSVQKAECTLV